jgi:hypothetical protein
MSVSETLLRDIAEFCRGARMAESTFGRLAVNDGKLVSRLRLGGRVTTDTVDRVRSFIAREPHRLNGTHAPAVVDIRAAGYTATLPQGCHHHQHEQEDGARDHQSTAKSRPAHPLPVIPGRRTHDR